MLRRGRRQAWGGVSLVHLPALGPLLRDVQRHRLYNQRFECRSIDGYTLVDVDGAPCAAAARLGEG